MRGERTAKKNGKKRWQKANESLKGGKKKERRKKASEFPPGGINTAR